MRAFELLPVAAQNWFCFWALLNCLAAIADAVLLFLQRRRLLFAASALCFFVSYYLMHVCRAGTEWRLHGTISPAAMAVLHFPAVLFFAVLLILSLLCALLFRNSVQWRKTHITAASIKESIDGLPAGVCFYLEDGRCIFSNHRMNDICLMLTGLTLQNGARLYLHVCESPVHVLSDGTAVSFRHRLLSFDGAPLHELIADDITELNEKNERLRAENARARRLAADMRAYSETISDTVRRQETLQAKISIHDEMNRLILATGRAVESGDAQERAGILRLWQSQALLLCKEADTRRKSSTVSDLNTLASVLGLRLIWNGGPETQDPAVLSLFLSAAREAMTNAVKHARATALTIEISEDEMALCAAFTNDGEPPAQEINESGGLASLRQRLERAGGAMRIETQPRFSLHITIPKEILKGEAGHAV